MHIDDKAAGDTPADSSEIRQDAAGSAGGAVASPAPVAAPPGRGWALRVAFIALLLGVGGTLAGYFAVRHLDAQQQSQAQRTAELRTAFESARQQQDEFAARLARVEGELPGVAEEMAQVEDLLRRDAMQRIEPADVERLLRIANDSLQLERDVATALLALRNADQRLQALGDPLFAEVRRRLAQEITALAAVPQPDIAGMAYTLSSLQGELGSLLLKREAPVRLDEEQPGATADRGALPRWRILVHDMWVMLKSLVVVRHREGNEPPLIAPGEQVFLTQNLYLKLESARLALLGRDNRNFHASLEAARTWLRDYYDDGSAAAAAVSARLSEMEQADIAPPLPDISASLHALQTALERRRVSVREGATRPPANSRPSKDRTTGGGGGP